MKIKILFAIDSLNLGGAEKSLITLLNLLDYSKVDVDLQLFAYGGEFEKFLPKEVNILKPIKYFEYCKISYISMKKYFNILSLFSQVTYSMKIRFKSTNHIEKSVLLWKSINQRIEKKKKVYDYAIAYAQGLPTFYISDKIRAKNKAAWINCSYLPEGKYLKFIQKKYDNIGTVNCVSNAVKKEFEYCFRQDKIKIICIKDIIDDTLNYKLSEEYFVDSSKDGCMLLTVGRLDKHKGYDLSLDACRYLKNKGVSFKWYIIGEGIERKFIEEKIEEYKLNDNFILLGAKANPYPYYKACDIYVQTSRHEGFGISVAEAKQFHKPIIATNFETIYTQISNNKNGIIVEMDAKKISNAIEEMISNDLLRKKIISNLMYENMSNNEELMKFYNYIGLI